MEPIKIRGLMQNNVKNVDLDIPKHKIVVFTGVSGSGKSSIVFDTIAKESARQLNETFPAFIKGKLPQYARPNVQRIENLSPSVCIDQTSLGGNARSTVGTMSDLYSDLRVLFSRIAKPSAGSASYYSFNDPKGMCRECAGLGEVVTLNIAQIIDWEKSLNEGCVLDSSFAPHTWYWKQYANSGFFDLHKPIKEYSEEELHHFLYGVEGKKAISGILTKFRQTYLERDISEMSKSVKDKANVFTKRTPCTCCHGKRLNPTVLDSKILGYSIADLCEMELSELQLVLAQIQEPSVASVLSSLQTGIQRMIDIGLPYLHLNRSSESLSGGEAQRLKLVRYLGSSLSDMLYIFDEPSTGMHPHDVQRVNHVLLELKRRGNSVLVVEHDKDVIRIADQIIDVGMKAGKEGGEIVFQGSYQELLQADTPTAKALRDVTILRENVRSAKGVYPIRHACLHNLQDVSVDIPKGILTVVTGVAGSGKSSLISRVFANTYKDEVIVVNQKPIFATNRSTPVSYLGILDTIRDLFAREHSVERSLFSFNSKGACPECKGKGVVVTELVHMSPVITTCECCGGSKYNAQALSYRYKGKNMEEVLAMSVAEALAFFKEETIVSKLRRCMEIGLSYMQLGQTLTTLSGGEIQRIKLAQAMHKKGKIYLLDEPTTGLHPCDVTQLMTLFHSLVEKGNTVIIIEHNLDVIKQADWIIDVGPEGGKNGGRILFEGTPIQMLQAEGLTADCLRSDIKVS